MVVGKRSLASGSGPNVGVLMFVAYRAMEHRILEALHTAGFDDVTLSQARVFARVGESGTRLTDLAEMAQVTKQTAQVTVDRLERAGYLERVADPTDGRARLVRLAARGRAAQARANGVEREIEDEWAAHLGAKDWARLRDILLRLREVTDPYRHLDP